MIKLVFKNPTYRTYMSKTICKLGFSIVDTETKEIYMSSFRTGVSKCNEEDSYSDYTGKDIALSRAKIKSYKIGKTFSNTYPDSIKWTIFNVLMEDYIDKEISHTSYLISGIETPTFTIDTIEDRILEKVSYKLPMLKEEEC